MLAEHRLHPSDLIWPLFVADGKDGEEPIASLPGVSRWTVDRLAARAREARDLGIPCLALFPNTPGALRTDDAREALNPDNRCAARSGRSGCVPRWRATMCARPLTAHGHDGCRPRARSQRRHQCCAATSIVMLRPGRTLSRHRNVDGRVGAIRRRSGASTAVASWLMPPNMLPLHCPSGRVVQPRPLRSTSDLSNDPGHVGGIARVELDIAEGGTW